MGFTKTFKLTKEPRTFQAGESTGFQLSLGSQYYDRKSKKKEWANYKAVIFAKGNQLGFYHDALVVGAVVELSCDDLKIDNYNPEYLVIEMIDARLGFIHSPQGHAPKQQSQGQWQQQQQQTNQTHQKSQQMPDFDEMTPF